MLKIEAPLQTMEKLMDFFVDRKIIIDSLHMQMVEGAEARLLICCLIEKDRINHTRYALEKCAVFSNCSYWKTRNPTR
jgi:hypothetical protein